MNIKHWIGIRENKRDFNIKLFIIYLLNELNVISSKILLKLKICVYDLIKHFKYTTEKIPLKNNQLYLKSYKYTCYECKIVNPTSQVLTQAITV